MNAVGIDISKGKSMVAIMLPFGEVVSPPFEIKHTTSDIRSLVELIHSVDGETRIVMEHTLSLIHIFLVPVLLLEAPTYRIHLPLSTLYLQKQMPYKASSPCLFPTRNCLDCLLFPF